MIVYVLTREENQYDQYGEYFEAVFKDKPSYKELLGITGCPNQSLTLLEVGGGRLEVEDTWYNLLEVEI